MNWVGWLPGAEFHRALGAAWDLSECQPPAVIAESKAVLATLNGGNGNGGLHHQLAVAVEAVFLIRDTLGAGPDAVRAGAEITQITFWQRLQARKWFNNDRPADGLLDLPCDATPDRRKESYAFGIMGEGYPAHCHIGLVEVASPSLAQAGRIPKSGSGVSRGKDPAPVLADGQFIIDVLPQLAGTGLL